MEEVGDVSGERSSDAGAGKRPREQSVAVAVYQFGWMLVAVSFPDADLVAQHPEGHERIGAALMFDEDIQIGVQLIDRGFEQDVCLLVAQVVIDEGSLLEARSSKLMWSANFGGRTGVALILRRRGSVKISRNSASCGCPPADVSPRSSWENHTDGFGHSSVVTCSGRTENPWVRKESSAPATSSPNLNEPSKTPGRIRARTTHSP